MTDLEKVIEDLIAKRKNLATKVKKETADVKQNFLFEIDTVSESNRENVNTTLALKKEIIKHLQAAKASHKKWMSYVQILIRLGDVETANTSIPINYTMCDFGKWYYGEGQVLTIFPEYEQMEDIHKNVHDTYLQIYELYITPIKGSLFNSEKSQLAARNKKALALSQILDEYSKIMYDLLVSVENSVRKLSNEELKKLL
jgi:hypothetical protein